MDEFLNSLKIKEREIMVKLEESPLFRQLESLRSTIATFESNGAGGSLNGHSVQPITPPLGVYDAANFTWRERVLYVVRKLGAVGVGEIISEIQSLEPDVYTKAFLDKRVGVTLSQLKKKGVLGARLVNKKRKYFIK